MKHTVNVLDVLRAEFLLVVKLVVEILDHRSLQLGKPIAAETGDDVVVDDVCVTGSCTELYI